MFQSFYFFISVGLGTSVKNFEQSYETTQRREKLHPEIEPRMAEPHDTGRYSFGQGWLRLSSEKSGWKYREERDPDYRWWRHGRQGQYN